MTILVAKPQASTAFGLVQYPLCDIVLTALITLVKNCFIKKCQK